MNEMLKIWTKELGLQFFRHSLSPFLWTGSAFLSFFYELFSNLKKIFTSFRQSLKIIDRGLQIEFQHKFI